MSSLASKPLDKTQNGAVLSLIVVPAQRFPPRWLHRRTSERFYLQPQLTVFPCHRRELDTHYRTLRFDRAEHCDRATAINTFNHLKSKIPRWVS